MFHLLTVFMNYMSEALRCYFSKGLKKPTRVPITHFIQHVQQLNNCLDLLPCVYYSQQSTKIIKIVEPFDDPDLASHIL